MKIVFRKLLFFQDDVDNFKINKTSAIFKKCLSIFHNLPCNKKTDILKVDHFRLLINFFQKLLGNLCKWVTYFQTSRFLGIVWIRSLQKFRNLDIPHKKTYDVSNSFTTPLNRSCDVINW